MFGVLQPLSFCSCIVLSFKSDAIKKHDLFFVIVVLCQRISVFSCAYHLERIVGWLPCFSCLVFLSISFTLKSIICLSETPCFGPRLEFFLMTKPGIEVQSLFAVWIPRVLQISPATAMNDPDFGNGISIRTLMFCISVWFMSTSNSCDSSLNLLISCFFLIWRRFAPARCASFTSS